MILKDLFIFQQKKKLQEQLFEKKIETTIKLSLSLQISLSDLNNTGLEDGTNREYMSYMRKNIYHFLILKSFGVSAYIF